MNDLSDTATLHSGGVLVDGDGVFVEEELFGGCPGGRKRRVEEMGE